MSGIRAVGRVGSTIVPNWRWEDPNLDSYQLRIAGWLVSNTIGYTEDTVTRNLIAKRTGISIGKVSSSVKQLAVLGIIEYETVPVRQAEGGHRWIITVYLDVWQEPRSPDGATPVTSCSKPGHVVTATTGNSVIGTGVSSSAPSQAIDADAALDAGFDKFWKTYKRTGPKKVAHACWRAAIKKDSPENILAGLMAWVAYWNIPGSAQMKWPQGWLNEERWNDVPPSVAITAPRNATQRSQAVISQARERSQNNAVNAMYRNPTETKGIGR
jgi:hypothetical protein